MTFRCHHHLQVPICRDGNRDVFGVITHLHFDLLLQVLISCFSYCFFFSTKNSKALCLLHTYMGKKNPSSIYEANENNFFPMLEHSRKK